jgi:hypothetical protein
MDQREGSAGATADDATAATAPTASRSNGGTEGQGQDQGDGRGEDRQHAGQGQEHEVQDHEQGQDRGQEQGNPVFYSFSFGRHKYVLSTKSPDDLRQSMVSGSHTTAFARARLNCSGTSSRESYSSARRLLTIFFPDRCFTPLTSRSTAAGSKYFNDSF